MESQHKINSFHIVKTISGEICLDYTYTNNSQKKKNKIIKTKNKKKNSPKKENINTNTISPKKKREKKEFIPLPLINNSINNNINNNNDENNNSTILSHHHNNSFKINNNNSFSYLNENINKNKTTNTNNNLDNHEDKNTQTKIAQSINQFLSNNFLCKKHINREYSSYCSRCKENICRECILDDLNHIRHKIYNWKDIIPTDFKISCYQKIILLNSKYYLKRIRNIIIEIYNDLFDFYGNETDYLIKELQKHLIKTYKFFYQKNYYQIKYAENITNFLFYFKDKKLLNYQIIKNFNELKINSLKLPDLNNQHTIIKARTMIEFMIDNNNNILKSSDSDSIDFDKIDKIKNLSNNEKINIIQKSKEIYYIQKPKDQNYINNTNNNIFNINNIPKKKPNFDSKIKNYIFTNLPKPYTNEDEVEYRNNIQYIYYDKSYQKEIKCTYHGEFKKNTLIRHGRGLFIWGDGEYYLGYWENDRREGHGTNSYSNGDKYQGEYKNGKKDGKGIYEWKNGDIYSGDWKNDMKDGEGKYFFKNGDKFIGVFKMDKIEGNGLYIWANSNKYKGQFKNNEIEGKGILTYLSSNSTDIKDIHSRITYIKNKEIIIDNIDDSGKLYDERKNIEIITCDRNNINKFNTNIENDNKQNIK